MEQLIFIAVIALISFVNWLMQRSAELREKRRLERRAPSDEPQVKEADPYVAPRPVAPDPGPDMRKLMEALGLPIEEAAPPPLPAAEEEKPVIVQQPPPPPAVVAPPVRSLPPAVAPVPASRWTPLLHKRDELRKAIIVREILGPPKALTV